MGQTSSSGDRLKRQQQDIDAAQYNSPYFKESGFNIIHLRRAVDILKGELTKYHDILSNVNAPMFKVANAQSKIAAIEEKFRLAERSLKLKELDLRVMGNQCVAHVWNSLLLEKRMNARALKTRLVANVQACKFEHDKVERTFWSRLNSKEFFTSSTGSKLLVQAEQRVNSQISDNVKQRAPGRSESN
ncbi:hypothetical protein PM082_014398 [Marasmius tenuissimus]|nr:hypothetical protein PM082_014398 [Marasmius tenuissimus]